MGKCQLNKSFIMGLSMIGVKECMCCFRPDNSLSAQAFIQKMAYSGCFMHYLVQSNDLSLIFYPHPL